MRPIGIPVLSSAANKPRQALVMKLTAPQRGVLASFAFLLISMLSAQALAFYSCAVIGLQCFDRSPFSYSITSGTTVEVRCQDDRGVTPAGTCRGEKDIVIPATVSKSGTTYSVTAIGRYAFAVNALTSVIIPDSVTTIGNNAFTGNALTSVIIPDSVTTIGNYAFDGNALTSVIIPDSVTTIGKGAFYENALTSVIIPDSVTTIGNSAFSDNALTSVIIPDSVTTIGLAAFDGNALTSVTIPASVTTIEVAAFSDNALTSVTIPASVTTIEVAAFSDNALTSVTIPASVTTIEVAAFSDNALTSAHFGGNFGDFQLNTTGSGSTEREAMFDVNPNLTTITYCEGTTGWPQDFSNGSTTITATSIVCSPPDAPTIDSITPGAGQLTVAFTPGIDNGSPAYSYEASCLRVVGSGRVRVNVVGPTSPITVPSMYNDDTYECFVTATNIIGTSPASATSEPFVVGGPDTFVPPPSGAPPPSSDTPPSSATPVPTSPIWLLGMMAGLLSLVAVKKLRKA